MAISIFLVSDVRSARRCVWEGESLCRLLTRCVRSYIMVTSVQGFLRSADSSGLNRRRQRGGRNWQERRKAGLVEGLVMGSDKSVHFPGLEGWEGELQGRT